MRTRNPVIRVDRLDTNEDWWRVRLSLWALAAAVRLTYLAAVQPAFTIYYWDAASSLRQNGSLSIEGARSTSLDPLYPLFLAAVRWLVQDRPLAVQGIQALVASIGAVYMEKLAFALTGKRQVSIVAAALFAVYPLLVRYAVDGTETALSAVLLVAFAYQFVTMRRTFDAAAAGGWLGLAILTRIVVLPLIVIAPFLTAARRGKRAAIAMGAVTMIVLAPYSIRNYMLNGAILPTRGGVNLFMANSEYSAGVIADYGPDVLHPYAEARLASEGLAALALTPEAEHRWDVALRRMALAEIMSHPVAALQLKVRNLFTFFSPILVPHRKVSVDTQVQLGDDGHSVVVNSVARPLSQQIGYTVSYSVVIALAFVGFYTRRHSLADDGILWWIVLTFTVVYSVFSPLTRYRTPVDFVFLFYAAVGVVALIGDRWHSRLSTGHPGRLQGVSRS
jgi:hypothetical protein